MKKLLYLVIVFSILISCKTKENTAEKPKDLKVYGQEKKDVELEGIIQKQGITNYQYGTHVLKGKKTYALKSKTISLNNYVGKKVKIQGSFIAGYPIEGGPQYVNVKKVTVQ